MLRNSCLKKGECRRLLCDEGIAHCRPQGRIRSEKAVLGEEGLAVHVEVYVNPLLLGAGAGEGGGPGVLSDQGRDPAQPSEATVWWQRQVCDQAVNVWGD